MVSNYNLGHERMTPYFHRVRRGLLDIIDSCNGDKTKHTEKKLAERALDDFDAGWAIFEKHDDLTQGLEEELKMMATLKHWKEQEDVKRLKNREITKWLLWVVGAVISILGALKILN